MARLIEALAIWQQYMYQMYDTTTCISCVKAPFVLHLHDILIILVSNA